MTHTYTQLASATRFMLCVASTGITAGLRV
jgi:hypothetical protein